MNKKPFIDEQLRESYQSAIYEIHHPPFCIYIGEKSEELDVLLVDNYAFEACMITAYNPGSQLKSKVINDENQNRLVEYLRKRKHPIIPAVSKDPEGKWPKEPQLLILGIKLKEAKAIALLFDQVAILHHRLNQPTALVWLETPLNSIKLEA